MHFAGVILDYCSLLKEEKTDWVRSVLSVYAYLERFMRELTRLCVHFCIYELFEAFMRDCLDLCVFRQLILNKLALLSHILFGADSACFSEA